MMNKDTFQPQHHDRFTTLYDLGGSKSRTGGYATIQADEKPWSQEQKATPM